MILQKLLAKSPRLEARLELLELATSVSGVALAAFMLMHMSLLSTVLIGAQTMDDLASFRWSGTTCCQIGSRAA